MEEFKIRLQKAMEIRNMKPSDLSKKTGISKGALSNYLKGRYKAAQTNTFLLAKALDVDEAWLMGYEVPMARYEPFEPNTINGFELTDNMIIDPDIDQLLRILKLALYNITDNEERLKAKKLLQATIDMISK